MPAFDLTETSDRRSSNKVFKALSDSTRRQILVLLEERHRNVGEIVGQFDLTQPTISRHGRSRVRVGWFALAIFILTFTPVPFSFN